MAKTDDFNSGLGNIDHIMHNQGVADLSWLDVNEEDYRACESLPRQNLDIIPELQRALSVEDDIPHVIPMRPHTIVNTNPVDIARTSPVDMTAPIRNRTAHLTIAGLPTNEIRRRLALEFAPGDIHLASDAINNVLFENGLLGNVYIDSNHFPRCASSKNEQKLVNIHGKKALYILAKESCPDCVCNHGGFCSAMGSKKLVDEIPYGPKLAIEYHQRLAAEKRPINMLNAANTSKKEWKERIRAAFIQSPIVHNPDGVQKIQTRLVPAEPVITAADMAAFWARRSSNINEPAPSSDYLKFARRMMQGYNDIATLAGSGISELVSLASEYGLLGHTYLDMDALGGCRSTLNFIQKRNDDTIASRNDGVGDVPDFVLRRSSSCQICKNLPDGACAEISRISVITNSKPSLDKKTFARSLIRAVGQGRINTVAAHIAAKKVKDNANWTLLTAQMNLYKPKVASIVSYDGSSVSYHYGSPSPSHELGKAVMDPEEVRRTLSHLMNTGLSGRNLQVALLSRYSRDDLAQVPEIGRQASVDDGVQGHYFIDPTAYHDYGRGCVDGAHLFRKQGAKYILASDKCTGCRLQTHPGWCSKYSKDLIHQVPEEARKIAAEVKKRLPVMKLGPIENPVEKYELASELIVDLGNERDTGPEISINSPIID